MSQFQPNFIVLDGNAPWVRLLFEAVSRRGFVKWFRSTSGPLALKATLPSLNKDRRSNPTSRICEQKIIFPGWTRFPRWSARIAARHIERSLEDTAGKTIVVYTLPWYGEVAERLTNVPAIYFAFDPYSSYVDWNEDRVARDEAKLLRRCRAIFAVSPALAADFRQRTDRRVYVQPNGISEDRLDASVEKTQRPVDLPTGRRLVLCVGQISSAYDWPLLKDVIRRCRELTFVFIGPLLDLSPAESREVHALLNQVNVIYLGYRSPEQLPPYLAHCDVLFSPLAVTPANDRRSLLRLYDYLATDRPIVATPIASSLEHEEYLSLAASPDDYVAALRSAIASPSVDRTARITYLRGHTWAARAELFLQNLEEAMRPEQLENNAAAAHD